MYRNEAILAYTQTPQTMNVFIYEWKCLIITAESIFKASTIYTGVSTYQAFSNQQGLVPTIKNN
jgi:hypothetical protein